MNKEDEMVAIYRATNRDTAETIRALLQRKDIPCRLEPLKLWISPGSSMVNRGEVNVMVPESQAESAIKLLKRRRYVQVYKRAF